MEAFSQFCMPFEWRHDEQWIVANSCAAGPCDIRTRSASRLSRIFELCGGGAGGGIQNQIESRGLPLMIRMYEDLNLEICFGIWDFFEDFYLF